MKLEGYGDWLSLSVVKDVAVGAGGLVASGLFDNSFPVCRANQDYTEGDLIMVRLWPPEVQKMAGVQGSDVTPLKEAQG